MGRYYNLWCQPMLLLVTNELIYFFYSTSNQRHPVEDKICSPLLSKTQHVLSLEAYVSLMHLHTHATFAKVIFLNIYLCALFAS